MRSKLRAFLAISVVSAALTACSDQPTSAPIVPRVAGINAIVNIPNDCNFTDLRAAVRAYVDAGNDEIFDYIGAMDTDAYGQGMNALARLAEVRLSTADKEPGATPEQGAAAVMEILACMPVGDSVQAGFATNIVAAMGAGGMFDVPTTGSSAAVFSSGEPPLAQFWAAKPDSNETWGSLTNDVRYMVFGYKINNGAGFNYNVVPMLGEADMPEQFADSLILGACGGFADSIRVEHVGEVLFDEDMSFCVGASSPPLGALSSGVGANFASLVRRSLSVLTPKPAYAAVWGGGVGGAITELSPTNLLPVSPTITFTQQPLPNKSVGDALGILIFVSTGANPALPLNNAEVTLTVTGNSGQAALFLANGQSCFQVTRLTNPSGIAYFSDVAVAKSGGYTLTATAEFDDLDANAVVSNLFNVKNKKITLPASCPPA
jgi:hypothetical protein